MNTYVIADIHGRLDLLVRALQIIEADAGGIGKVIVLGDFIDRGPDSAGVIQLLMSGHPEILVLQGNHEAMMLTCLDQPHRISWWLGNGGTQTLQSYGYEQGDSLKPLKIPAEHLDWLSNLPITYEDQDRIYVHAGVPFDQPLQDVSVETLQWMLYRDGGEVYQDAEYYDDRGHISGKHIVHGHHQSLDHPLLKPHRTNLDSFAWYTGRLAIGVFDDRVPGGPVRVLEATLP